MQVNSAKQKKATIKTESVQYSNNFCSPDNQLYGNLQLFTSGKQKSEN